MAGKVKIDGGRAFWDPHSGQEYYAASLSEDLRARYGAKEMTFDYNGQQMTIKELVDRLIKVEEALADYIILGDHGEPGNTR